jgi:hypothetical protein
METNEQDFQKETVNAKLKIDFASLDSSFSFDETNLFDCKIEWHVSNDNLKFV